MTVPGYDTYNIERIERFDGEFRWRISSQGPTIASRSYVNESFRNTSDLMDEIRMLAREAVSREKVLYDIAIIIDQMNDEQKDGFTKRRSFSIEMRRPSQVSSRVYEAILEDVTNGLEIMEYVAVGILIEGFKRTILHSPRTASYAQAEEKADGYASQGYESFILQVPWKVDTERAKMV